PLGAAARRVPFLLRSSLPDPPARPVGGRNRVRLRATAVGGGLRAHHGRRPELRCRRLHERHHVLHPRPGRRRPANAALQAAHHRRGRNGIRVPGRRDRILPGDLPVVLTSRGSDLTARRARRLAAERGGAVVAAPRRSGSGRARRPVAGMGALGGRRAREPPLVPAPGAGGDRLRPAGLERLRARLASGGMRLKGHPDFAERLAELRRMYEPYVIALARYLALPLPPWIRAVERPDNWQTSAWDRVV